MYYTIIYQWQKEKAVDSQQLIDKARFFIKTGRIMHVALLAKQIEESGKTLPEDIADYLLIQKKKRSEI
jgi:hypothetical protein